MKAIWTRKTIGMSASAEKVAARTIQALVMTPPVTASATRIPGLVPRSAYSSRTLVIRKME